MNETVMTQPAADVGTLEVRRFQDSPTRFEIWHIYGLTHEQVGWMKRSRNRYETFYVADCRERISRGGAISEVLNEFGLALAERDRARREAAAAARDEVARGARRLP